MHQIVGHPAEQPLEQAHMTISAHDNKVRLITLSSTIVLGDDVIRRNNIANSIVMYSAHSKVLGQS